MASPATVDAFLALKDDMRRSVLGSLTPDTKQALLTSLRERATGVPALAPPPAVGSQEFKQKLGAARQEITRQQVEETTAKQRDARERRGSIPMLGLPIPGWDIKKDASLNPETPMPPVEDIPVLGGASRLGRGAFTNQNPGVPERIHDIVGGGMEAATPVVPFGLARAPGMMLLRGLVGGIAGQQAAQYGVEAVTDSPAWGQAAGDIGAIAGGGLAGRGRGQTYYDAKAAIKIGERHEAARKQIINILNPSATDPNVEGEFEAALPWVAREMGDTSKVPPKVQDLVGASDAALKRQGGVIDRWVRAYGDGRVPYDRVGREMRSQVTPEFIEQSPGAAEQIIAESRTYSGTRSLRWVHEALKLTNNALDALMKESPSQQQVKINNPRHGYLVAKKHALQQILYENMPQEFRVENQRYGAIKSIKDLAMTASTRANRELPKGVTLATASEAAELGAGLATQAAYPSKYAALRAGVRHAIGAPDTMDKRFASAWKDLRYTIPDESVVPERPQPMGLLGPGGILTPPPADTSFVHGVPAAPPARAESRMLPPASDMPGPRQVRSRIEPPPAGDLPATLAATPGYRKTVTMQEIRDMAEAMRVAPEDVLREALKRGIKVRGGHAGTPPLPSPPPRGKP